MRGLPVGWLVLGMFVGVWVLAFFGIVRTSITRRAAVLHREWATTARTSRRWQEIGWRAPTGMI